MVNPTTSPKAMSASGLCSKSVMRTPGPTVLQRTVGQYSRTVYTNTVMVARLVPPIRGTLPSKVYSSTGTVQKHDTTVPTTTTTTSTSTALALGHAVEKLQLCDSATTKLPPAKTQELDDQSPTKQILKFNNNNKDLTMKTNTPTTTPTRPKKAKPVNTETFDDINDVPATLGSSPVPEGTPTHPFLYHGALAYGSPKKSKLANLMFPTTPTSGDDQKIKKDPNITKKKRTFSNKSGATNDDDIDTILEEFRDLDSTVITTEMDKKIIKKPKHHHHQEEEEEEEEEETNVSMPTEETTNVTKDPTNTTAAVDRPSTNIASCPDPTIPTFAAYPMSDEAFQTPPKRRLFIFPRRVEDDPVRHQDERPTDTTTQSVVPLLSNNQDDDRKPAALPFFRIPTLIWSKSKQLLSRSPNAAELTTTTNDLTTTDTTNTMDNTTTMKDTTTKDNQNGVTYNLPALSKLVEHDDSKGLQTLHQDLLSLVEALEDLHRNPEKEPPKGTQKKLLLFRHFLRNLPENYGNGDLDTLKTALRLVSTALTAVSPAEEPEEDTPTDPILETFENRRDESAVLDVGTLQNSETDNPPESLRSLDTCHPQNLLAHLESALQPYQNRPDVIDENHDVIIPGYADVDENISLPPSSSSESYTPRSNTANTPRCFSDLSTPRYPFCSPAYSYCSPVRSTDVSPSPGTPSPTTGASPPYHRRDTTVYLTTVVKTDTGLNLPHLAHCTLSNTNPTSSQATLHDEVQHPVPIKLEDNPEINTGINYYSDSNDLPSNDNSFAYPVSPPFHSHDDEGHFAMLCMEENKSFDDDQPNNLLSNEAQEEDLPSEYQPPARMLPSLFPDPPYRPDDNLSEIHLNPFRMFQEEDYNAPAELSFPDAILHDDKNGPIRLRDLPICVNTSITIASFCLNYLDAPPAVNYIRDINRHHLFWYFYSINSRSLHITRAPYHMGRPLSDILSVECMTHTLNRATYLLLAHLRSPQRELFPQNLPSSFNDLDDDQSEIMSKCATAFIYALRMILFPKSTTFRKLPYFIQDTFQDIDQFPMPPDELTHHQLEDLRSSVTHIESQFRAANPFTTAFVNTFDTHADTQATALHIAQEFIRFAILQHGMAHHKICISRDPEFSQYEIIVGNLPPADHLLSAFSVSFPMVTKPSDVQLATSYSTDTALAINFVVCKPFNITTIMNLQYHDPLRYIDALQTVTPIATNSANDSIDFLPHSEYILFRVVQLIDPKDPTGILPKNCPPSHGVIFQGSPLCGPTYSYGSPTEMAIPTARAGIFPVTLDHDQQPIIIDPDGNPYTKESVKSLFYKQAAKPLQTYNLDDPDWIQHNPAELWRNEHSQMYHIARDPTKIPFSWLSA
ncbi:hypothetical protein MHU86_46 [Fragilaria crotonensis]|nr:hypothetical protein MHU86_46 [Fragilaria crotonensis]